MKTMETSNVYDIYTKTSVYSHVRAYRNNVGNSEILYQYKA